MQIVSSGDNVIRDNLSENVKSCFLDKIRKYLNVSSAENVTRNVKR